MALLCEPPSPRLLFLLTNECIQIKPDILFFSFLYLSQCHIVKHSFLYIHFSSFLFSNCGCFQSLMSDFLSPPLISAASVWTVLSTLTAATSNILSASLQSLGSPAQLPQQCREVNISSKTLNQCGNLLPQLLAFGGKIPRSILCSTQDSHQNSLISTHSNKQLHNNSVDYCPAPTYHSWSLTTDVIPCDHFPNKLPIPKSFSQVLL